jgi:hypothetical protein
LKKKTRGEKSGGTVPLRKIDWASVWCLYVSMSTSPCLCFACFHVCVFMFPCFHVSMTPCFHVSMFPEFCTLSKR